jgi:hypothetical protein
MKRSHLAPFSCSGVFLTFFCLLAVLIGGAPLSAQLTTARLSGIVTDNTGSALAGADVSVEGVQTGYKQTMKTGTAGEYLFPSLPVGEYTLTIDMGERALCWRWGRLPAEMLS